MSTAGPTHRQRQAAETRRRVVAAARQVFADTGYSRATIADVARAAGVAIPTIYKVFGTKGALLTAVIDAWREQFAPSDLTAIPSEPRQALAAWAAIVRQQWEHGLDIATLYSSAGAADPDVRTELSSRLAGRERWVRHVAQQLIPHLADGISVEHAQAVLSGLALPELYRELVEVRGWTPDSFQKWLQDTLQHQLLRENSVGHRKHPQM